MSAWETVGRKEKRTWFLGALSFLLLHSEQRGPKLVCSRQKDGPASPCPLFLGPSPKWWGIRSAPFVRDSEPLADCSRGSIPTRALLCGSIVEGYRFTHDPSLNNQLIRTFMLRVAQWQSKRRLASLVRQRAVVNRYRFLIEGCWFESSPVACGPKMIVIGHP